MRVRGTRWWLRTAVGAALLAGCGATLPEPTALDATWAQARWPGATVGELAEGRDLYVRKCGGCHQLYPLGEVTAERWPTVIAQMSGRAALGDHERELITRYVLAAGRAR